MSRLNVTKQWRVVQFKVLENRNNIVYTTIYIPPLTFALNNYCITIYLHRFIQKNYLDI